MEPVLRYFLFYILIEKDKNIEKKNIVWEDCSRTREE
jgi:hypothetical protein